mgnify:FL=1
MKVFVIVSLCSLAALTFACQDSCAQCTGMNNDLCSECKPGYYLKDGVFCLPCHEGCKRCNGPQKSDCMGEELYEFLSLHRVLLEGDLSLPSKKVSLKKGYTLHFDFLNDTFIGLIEFNISNGFFGLGFGTNMTNADIIAFETNNNEITVTDRWSKEHGKPSLDTELGGTNDVTRLGYELSGGVSKVKFSRKMNTGDKYDKVIVNGENDMIFSYSTTSKVLDYHENNRMAKKLDLSKSS